MLMGSIFDKVDPVISSAATLGFPIWISHFMARAIYGV